MDESGRKAIADSYLEHIKIAVKVRDSSAPFRDFLDNWYAFSEQAAGLLTKGGRPIWFNKPDAHTLGSVLQKMHYVSPEALKIIELARIDKTAYRTLFKAGDPSIRLMVDHAVPITVLVRMLFEGVIEIEASNIHDFLRQFYRLGVITIEEDTKLNKIGLRSKMPDDWNGNDPFSRYVSINIQSIISIYSNIKEVCLNKEDTYNCNQIDNAIESFDKSSYSVSYKSNRLTFKRDIIEKLNQDDFFCIVTPGGTFRFTKKSFYETFPKLVKTESYLYDGVYSYSKLPHSAERFRIP